jgi:hypothetical protein
MLRPQQRLARNDHFIFTYCRALRSGDPESSSFMMVSIKRDAKLLGKLEQAEMQVIEKAKEQADEHCDYPAKSDNRLSAAG